MGFVSGGASAADLALKEDKAEKGVANGYAPLDGSSKVPTANLPTQLMEFKGNWDADTNTPTLANTDTDEQGTVYRVSVAGTTNFGAGNVDFLVGQWVVNDGTIWDQSPDSGVTSTANFWLSAESGKPQVANGAVREEVVFDGIAFDTIKFEQGVTQSWDWALFLPEDYDGGAIDANFQWYSPSTSADGVRWRIQGKAFSEDDLMSTAFGGLKSINDTNNTTANGYHTSITTTSAVVISNAGIGRKMQINIQRNGNNAQDSLLDDVFLVGVMLTYTKLNG